MYSQLASDQQACACWTAWLTTKRLLRDPVWETWLQAGFSAWRQALDGGAEPEPPLSIKVEPSGLRFSEPERAAAALHAIAKALTSGLQLFLPPAALDERLFGIGPEGWQVWRGGNFKRLIGEAGALRSQGAILLVVAAQVQDTLNATGEHLKPVLPMKMDEMAAALGLEPAPFRRFGRALDDEDVEFEDLKHLCIHALPGWLQEALNGDSRALQDVWRLRHPQSNQGEIAAAGSTATASDASEADSLRRWLKNEVADDEMLEGKDSGLTTLWKGLQGWPDTPVDLRNFLLRQRLGALQSHLEEIGRTDFHRLAPLPELGPKRQPPSPGLPVLDALWAVRCLQEAFPGRLGRSADSPLRLLRAFLACRQEDGSERRPEQRDRHCVLLGDEGPQLHALRPFGLQLLRLVEGEKSLQRTTTQFYLCLELQDGSKRQQLNVAFPWRFDKRNWATSNDRSKAAADEDGQLEKTAEYLDTLKQEERGRDLAGRLNKTHEAMADFREAWSAYRQAAEAEAFGEEAGLHVAKDTLWAPAENLITHYRKVLNAFAEVFAVAGDLAPRVAAGPLQTFLGFGLVGREGKPTENVRILGYHPIRLARLAALERAALEELAATTQQSAGLREIPLNTVPQLAGSPSVLWPPKAEIGLHDGIAFLVPASYQTSTDGPWEEVYSSFSHPRDREPDLIEALRPLLEGLARRVFPGLSRRLGLRLHEKSDTDRALRPMLLLADAVMREGRPVTAGIDLYLDKELAGDSVLARLDDDRDESLDDLQRLDQALDTVREDDPRPPLEIHPTKEVHPTNDAEDGKSEHLCLLVRPCGRRSRWVVRQPSKTSRDSRAMIWDPRSRSWNRLLVPDQDPDDLEHRFQNLLIRCWRGEADDMQRCLGRSLVINPVLPEGKAFLGTLGDAARRAGRVLVVDPVFGPEALDALEVSESNGMRVTWADYHRSSGWRITLLSNMSEAGDTAECQTAVRGLKKLFKDTGKELGRLAYKATCRTIPAVTLELWRQSDPAAEMNGELIGHLGVALFASSERQPIRAPSWPDGPWAALKAPFPPGTLLISMDSLQSWTWTRRSGTRGDFIAVVPDADAQSVRLIAIESKGSEGYKFYDGCRQAAVAADKLRERFVGPQRRPERLELMRCLAEEAFRTTSNHREAYDRVASLEDLDAENILAVCVSMARLGTGGLQSQLQDVQGRQVLWLQVGGAEGLSALVGVPHTESLTGEKFGTGHYLYGPIV